LRRDADVGAIPDVVGGGVAQRGEGLLGGNDRPLESSKPGAAHADCLRSGRAGLGPMSTISPVRVASTWRRSLGLPPSAPLVRWRVGALQRAATAWRVEAGGCALQVSSGSRRCGPGASWFVTASCRGWFEDTAQAAVRATVRTVMSSDWGAPMPKAWAASAMALAAWRLMAWVRSKPKSSRVVAAVASTTPSVTRVRDCAGSMCRRSLHTSRRG